MSEWHKVLLEEVTTKVGSGATPRGGKSAYKESGIPLIRSMNVHFDGFTDKGLAFIDEKQAEALKAVEVKPNDVLLNITGASIGRVTIAPKTMDGARVNQHVCIIRPNEKLYPGFLRWYLASPSKQDFIMGVQSGVTRQALTKGKILEFEIPLPEVEQQKRIVAKIEELFSHIDAGIEALKKAKQLLKQYRQSVLKAAVTGELTKEWREANKGVIGSVKELLESIEKPPTPNRWKTRSKEVIVGHPALAVGNPGTPLPEGWEWVALVNIAKMESGHTPSRRHPEWWDGDIAWIGIVDARQHHCGTIMKTIQHTNEDGLANSASRLLPKGTVCVSRTASVGYVVTMGRDMATSQDFVNWVPTPAVTSDWLQLIFIADTDGLRRFGKGTVHKTIYFPEWLSVHVGLPSIKEQLEISAIVNEKVIAMERLESEIDVQIIKAEKNKKSVLATAFNGILSC